MVLVGRGEGGILHPAGMPLCGSARQQAQASLDRLSRVEVEGDWGWVRWSTSISEYGYTDMGDSEIHRELE